MEGTGQNSCLHAFLHSHTQTDIFAHTVFFFKQRNAYMTHTDTIPIKASIERNHSLIVTVFWKHELAFKYLWLSLIENIEITFDHISQPHNRF